MLIKQLMFNLASMKLRKALKNYLQEIQMVGELHGIIAMSDICIRNLNLSTSLIRLRVLFKMFVVS